MYAFDLCDLSLISMILYGNILNSTSRQSYDTAGACDNTIADVQNLN